MPRSEQWVAITDGGSALEELARKREFRAIFPGEPTIGGRYSALSPFGIVPAALMNVDLARLLDRTAEMVEACRLADGNPGLELGLSLGEGWQGGRDKICMPNQDGFGLWAEQLVAESTGKQGKGLIPAPGESADGPDRQAQEVRLSDPYELGQEFFRWEFGTAVAGSILGINPFDQPDVQAAKDRTNEVLAAGDVELEPEGSVEELLAGASEGDYVCIQAFVNPTPTADEKLGLLADQARERIQTELQRRHARPRASLPPLDRPAAQGRSEHRSLHPGCRGLRRRAEDPRQAVRLRPSDPGTGGRRLRIPA